MFTRLIVIGVLIAAAIGWFGLQPQLLGPDPAGSADPAGAASGRRAVWQPSPIPSGQGAGPAPRATGADTGAGTTTGTTTGQGGAADPSAAGGRRAAWQPSPIPSQAEGARQGAPAAPPTTRTQPLPPVPQPNPAAGPAAGGASARTLPALPPISLEAPLSGVPDTERLADTEVGAGLGPVQLSDEGYIPYEQLLTTSKLETLFGGMLPQEQGEWREVRFFSRALGQEAAYLAWLPPGYRDVANARRIYPSLYLLHGVGGPSGYGPEEWLGYALTENLGRLLQIGAIEPMIVILPFGEQSYWINHANGGLRWADFVSADLVSHVDATFRTSPKPQHRATGGLSMGGHGALQLAYNHPGIFGIAGAHSPTLRPFEESPPFFGNQQWFGRFDPLTLVRRTDAAQKVLTWIDIGYEDPWRPAVELVVQALRTKRAPLIYYIFEGEHEGWYWME
ncbi:MAG TPA: alpha/beta hydrolase-fold protein, partial [Chloroflexota bacterium]|nr:alpha/beta hydrolase-fold protein [Chloroflexota bacterium]